MTAMKMSYKGFLFDVNPSSIKTQFGRQIETKTVPFGFGRSSEICRMPAKISGSGVFCTADAGEKAFELMRIFEKGGSSYLFVPKLAPMKAYFTDLTMSVNAETQSIEYSFSFTEDCSEKKSRYRFGYTYAKSGENLFDIANRCCVEAEKLFAANDFMDMFSVQEGDKVWLQ
ncbi:MAG: hypothetical protein E7571_01665 [Ruminococcaceae bacterium]|nr:hypothetical protein [Oscillospiraceae bacterium]